MQCCAEKIKKLEYFMKLSFTKKMVLESVEKTDEKKIIRFVSYLKEDYIERLLKISIKNNIITDLYFSSNNFGTAVWEKEKGLIDYHSWETENQLKEISYLSQHYPALLENGEVSKEYVLKKIIPDILDYLLDSNFPVIINNIINSPSNNIIYNWDDIINKNKKLSDDFINKLILKYENELREQELLKNDKSQIQKDDVSYLQRKENNFFLKKVNNIKNYFKKKKINDLTKTDDIKEYLERAKKLSKKLNKV